MQIEARKIQLVVYCGCLGGREGQGGVGARSNVASVRCTPNHA